MQREKLKQLFITTSTNFGFKLPCDGSFEPLFDMIDSQVKKVSDEIIEKKFQQLWLLTNDEWHKGFNLQWGGYPSLAQWLEILVAKPLTDEELLKRNREHKEKLTNYTKFITVWVNDPNLSISFCNRYKNPDNRHLKLMIDKYCKVTEELPEERVIKMSGYLKSCYEQNKDLFFKEMREIADDQNQLLLISN